MAETARSWGDGTPDTDTIVRAALELIDDDGLVAFSTRRLAARLGVFQPVIYRRVANRDELLNHVVALIMAEAKIPDKDLPWRESLRVSALTLRSTWAKHPSAGALLKFGGKFESIMAWTDSVIDQLRATGMADADVLTALDVIGAFVFGTIAVEAMDGPARKRPKVNRLTAAEARRFPNVAWMQSIIPTTKTNATDAFEAALDLLLDAIAARVPDTMAG